MFLAWMTLLLFASSGTIWAQALTVTGTVTDAETGEGIPGVNIVIQGTTMGAITDLDGNYTIEVPGEDAILQFSFVGYFTQSFQADQSVINVEMIEDIIRLDELVVIGYGSQRRGDLTGAIGVVDMDEAVKMSTNDFTKAIEGQVAGVSVQSGGEPGAIPQVNIRGIGTFGNNAPLYVIDGVVAPINDLPVSSIESVQVLKDASAAAIYGARAANGVVMITTKRGKAGKVQVTYDGYYGIQNIPESRFYDVLGREDYQMLLNEELANAGLDPVPGNDPTSPFYIDDIDTDWQKEALKTGSITEHTLGISGGNEVSTFNINLNYLNHIGTLEGPGPSYERYGVSVNSDHKMGKFTFGESIHYTATDQNLLKILHDGTPMWDMVKAIPTMPVYDENRLRGYGGADNQIHNAITLNVIGVNNIMTSWTKRWRFIGNAYGQYEFIPGLTYKLSLGYERTDWREFYFQPTYDLGWFFQNTVSKMNDWRGYGSTQTLNQTLTFDREFGDHHVTAMIGNTVLNAGRYRLHGHAEDFPEPYTLTLESGASGVSLSNDIEENRLLSYFGRLIYNYANRYLLTATIRRDGSSRFAPDYRWGNFPSVAAAWKVHNESFMQSVNALSQLKLRGSWGILGNQEIGNYRYSTYVNPYSHAVFNGVLAPGSIPLEFGTPDIRWEEKRTFNLGADLGFLNNRIMFTVEYYDATTDGLLVSVPIPESTGVYNWKSPTVNGAKVQNKGFEFVLGYNETRKKFRYSINANLSTLKNEVLSLGYGDNPIYGTGSRTAVGSEMGEFYGYIIEGIFQTQAEIDALNNASPTGIYQDVNTSPGDYKFKDIDGRDAEGKLTGAPDGFITDDDRAYFGKGPNPKLYFGLNFNASYGNLDFSLAAHGVAGNYILNSIRGALESASDYNNMSTDALNRWTPSNTDTDFPRLVFGDPNENSRRSERYLEKGDYLKISNIQVGYTIPEAISSRVRISRIRVYLSAQNVFTITKYTGFDPDFGYDNIWHPFDRGVDNPTYALKQFTAYMAGMPNPRTLQAGIQVGF